MTNHKDYESPTHNSDICINYFVSIFPCVLMFYYFRFIRLLNANNCFIITFSFKGTVMLIKKTLIDDRLHVSKVC